MSEPIHVISLGAGVQSSTMALMAAHGEITPMPKFAVFADTGDESTETISWVEQLERLLPFPTYIAHRSVLSEHLLERGHSQIPAFQPGSIGKRQCTKHWKIVPVQQRIREITETKRKRLPDGFVTLWMGISTDEISRCKDSRVPWIKHRWPLIDLMMSRRDCINWMARNGYPEAPKSACVFCPYRSPKQWRASKDKGGAEWEKIVRVSRQLEARGEFLTSHCLPIDQVDFSTDIERGQGELQFNNECSGMCGV